MIQAPTTPARFEVPGSRQGGIFTRSAAPHRRGAGRDLSKLWCEGIPIGIHEVATAILYRGVVGAACFLHNRGVSSPKALPLLRISPHDLSAGFLTFDFLHRFKELRNLPNFWANRTSALISLTDSPGAVFCQQGFPRIPWMAAPPRDDSMEMSAPAPTRARRKRHGSLQGTPIPPLAHRLVRTSDPVSLAICRGRFRKTSLSSLRALRAAFVSSPGVSG